MAVVAKLAKREMVRNVLRDHPYYTPQQVNRTIALIYNVSLASGWLQVYCREERPKQKRR